MGELDNYVQWLRSGKTPEDIRKDLIERGFSEHDARAITREIDDIFLSDRIARKTPRDGSVYKIVGWMLVGTTILISIASFIYANTYGGWFVIIGGGGGGFSLIRYGYFLESKKVIKREPGFPRKFQRRR